MNTRIRPPRPGRILGAALCLSAVLLLPAWTAIVVECDFLTLHRQAGVVFHGRCTARTEVPDGRPVPCTEYTFQVLEAFKGLKDAAGKPIEKVTFRHVGTRSFTDRADGIRIAPLRLGVPEYQPGDEMVLFLTRESPFGLCAPVGLSQGSFRVLKSEGKTGVRNQIENRGLFRGVGPESFRELSARAASALAGRGAALDLDQFLELCRKVKE